VPDPVVALWKDGLVERVDLGPLSRDEVEQLAAAVLGGPVVGTAVRDIYRASSGNAMLARDLVVGAIEAGRFTTRAACGTSGAGFPSAPVWLSWSRPWAPVAERTRFGLERGG